MDNPTAGAYNTTFNTIGVGNVVPAGANGQFGSGDKISTSKNQKIQTKKGPQNYCEPLPLIVYTNSNKKA